MNIISFHYREKKRDKEREKERERESKAQNEGLIHIEPTLIFIQGMNVS